MKTFTAATIKKVLRNAGLNFIYVDGQGSSTHIIVCTANKADALSAEVELDMAGYYVSISHNSVLVRKNIGGGL